MVRTVDVAKTEPKYRNVEQVSVRATIFVYLLLLGPVAVAQWEYGADIDLGAVQSDNIFLAPEGEKESETVYMLAPRFFMRTDGERLTADFRYTPQALFYSTNDDADSVFHSLDAVMTAALLRDRLFLHASAVNFQTVVVPEIRVPSNNIPITGNRLDSRIWEVRPYWQQRIGLADLLLEAAYFDVDYDEEELQSSNERHARIQLGNIQQQQGLAWEAAYRYRRTEYEVSTPWEFQRASLSLGYWFNGMTRLFTVGGAETAFDEIFESNMDADFWEAGIQYSPNQRLNVEFAAGDRSYGTSYRGNFTYRLKRGDIQLNYSEGPANRTETFVNRRPIVDTDNLDGTLDRPGRTDRFVQKRGQASARLELSKSNFTARVFSERRENRTTADGQDLSDEKYSGVALRWEWQLATKTSVSLGADSALREQLGSDSRLDRFQATLAYRLSQRLSLRLTFLSSRQDDDGGGSFEYVENQVGLFLRMSL